MKKKERRRHAQKRDRRPKMIRPQDKQATETMYGTKNVVDYVAVAIHRGSTVLAHRFFDRASYQDPDQMAREIVQYVKGHGVLKLNCLSEMLPPEYNSQGHRILRVADGGIQKN